jgi:hypothetical protein
VKLNEEEIGEVVRDGADAVRLRVRGARDRDFAV